MLEYISHTVNAFATDPLYCAAQIVGFISIVFSLLSFQQKKRKHILLFQMTASITLSAQYFMLGAITGGCLDLLAFVRTLIFSNNDKKWARSPIWLGVFVVIMTVASIVTWEGIHSIFALAGSLLSTVALWMKSCKHIRIISLLVGPCWIVYNLITNAFAGIVIEIVALTSILISLFRYDIKLPFKKEAKENA